MILIVLAVLAADGGMPDGGMPPLEEMVKHLRPDDEIRETDDYELTATAAWLLDARPKVVRVLISARLCMLGEMRSAALKEIAAEKKYGVIGGVVDQAKLHRLQDEIRAADDRTELQRQALREVKTTAISCGDRDVAGVSACLLATYRSAADGHDNSCGDNARYYRAMEVLSLRRGGGAMVDLPWQSDHPPPR